jgi:hypothetical protein
MNGSLYLLEFCPDGTVTSVCEHFVLWFLPSCISPIKNLATLLSHQATSLSAANLCTQTAYWQCVVKEKDPFCATVVSEPISHHPSPALLFSAPPLPKP